MTLHKKSSFPLRISLVNVMVTFTEEMVTFTEEMVTFTEEILNGKLDFLCIVSGTTLSLNTFQRLLL